MKAKRLLAILFATIILLLIPFIAMQFSDSVNWKAFDFILAGSLLLGTGLIYEFVIRKVTNSRYRVVLFVALLLVLAVVWAELAVGLFNTPFSGH